MSKREYLPPSRIFSSSVWQMHVVISTTSMITTCGSRRRKNSHINVLIIYRVEILDTHTHIHVSWLYPAWYKMDHFFSEETIELLIYHLLCVSVQYHCAFLAGLIMVFLAKKVYQGFSND